MIADRIRQARLASGRTQEDVAACLTASGQPLTKAGLSKYERNKSTPGQTFLVQLGKVLGVRPSYFVSEPTCEVTWFAFRKRSTMAKGRQAQVKAMAGPGRASLDSTRRAA
ncbi:MAG: helix-turn-helix transcriptional regulator [Planctomycetes bacterium]|nr:helix-turn-helix transcriptional regulator [Planctomycetota bacterium]